MVALQLLLMSQYESCCKLPVVFSEKSTWSVAHCSSSYPGHKICEQHELFLPDKYFIINFTVVEHLSQNWALRKLACFAADS